MEIPKNYKVLVVTLSDRAYRGEYEDESGPRIKILLSDWFKSEGFDYDIKLVLIPDEKAMLEEIIKDCRKTYDLVFTTGGTGIGPRDITVDTVGPFLEKEIPGIMEYIRVKYGAEIPGALLSRSIAGISGKAVIYTLPGSLKAVNEYMTEILRTLKHTICMQHGIDTHHRHQ